MIGKLLCIALLGLIAVALLGRAADHQVEDRILYVKDGQTLDCKRSFRKGHVFLDDCERIAP